MKKIQQDEEACPQQLLSSKDLNATQTLYQERKTFWTFAFCCVFVFVLFLNLLYYHFGRKKNNEKKCKSFEIGIPTEKKMGVKRG